MYLQVFHVSSAKTPICVDGPQFGSLTTSGNCLQMRNFVWNLLVSHGGELVTFYENYVWLAARMATDIIYQALRHEYSYTTPKQLPRQSDSFFDTGCSC